VLRRRVPSIEIVADGRGARIEGDTRMRRPAVELGAVTKVLTGLLLAELDRSGELPLTTPVGPLLDMALTHRGGDPVTLEDLATHHGGLPRLGPLGADGPVDPDDPYRSTGADGVLAALAATAGSVEGFVYSNLGYAALGIAVERAVGPWADLVTSRVLEPLGVTEVWPGPPPASVVRVEGRAGRRPVGWWNSGAFAPAVGASATGDGMAALLVALVRAGDPDAPLHAAVRAAGVPRRRFPGGAVGLGWQISDGGGLWHNGATAGFSALTALRDGRGVALLRCGPPDTRAERAAVARLR
jgi:D-alanyl-D-alanine-carboxypeptidase/D-alanyl-D-alanine-endopeptidase